MKQFFKKLATASFTFLSKFISIKDIKIAIREEAIKAIDFAENYVLGDGATKKEVAIDYIMSKIKLPLFVRPFKGLIKSIFSDFIDNVIEDVLTKVKQKIQ